MNEKELEIAEKVKQMLTDNLGIPAESLDNEIALFNEGIGLDSIDSLEIIACIDDEYGVQMTGVGKEHFYNVTSIAKYVAAHLE